MKHVRQMQKITSIEQLKREARNDADFALLLNYGLFSRKSIKYDDNSGIFSIWHHIDDTSEGLTAAELAESNIGKGIRKGAFVKLDDYEGGFQTR